MASRRKFSRLIQCGLFTVLVLLAADSHGAGLTVLSPNPDQYIIKGMNKTVKWEVPPGVGGKLKIELIRGNQSTVIGKNVEMKKGMHSCVIPSDLRCSDDYVMRISSVEDASLTTEIGPITVVASYYEKRNNLFNKPLGWAPSMTINRETIRYIDLERLRKAGISIDTLIDKRNHRKLIGAHYQGDTWDYAFISNDTVQSWLSGKLNGLLNDLGIKSGAESELHVSIELCDFFVREEDNYVGDIIGRTTVRNKAGVEIWRGLLRGHSTVWGKTYLLSNYQECIADAFILFSVSLLENLTIATANQ